MQKNQCRAEALFNLTHTMAGEYISGFEFPWQALKGLKDFIISLGNSLCDDYVEVSENVWVHKSAKIAPTAYLGAPCIIGAETEVRHCAFIRGSALIGCGCVIGNSVEIKNSILFDGVQTPHYNYVGDSILGYKAHMGAGAITSNVKSDKSPVSVKFSDGVTGSGMKKFGAMIGDFVEVGCNSVLNPGTVIGRNTSVYPLTSVRGAIDGDSIVKSGKVEIIKKK